MITDSQAHDLLDAAADSVSVQGPDADIIVRTAVRARRRRTLTRVGAAATVLVVAGVGLHSWRGASGSSDTATDTIPIAAVINTWPAPSNLMMQARIQGVLEKSVDGCLYLRSGDAVVDVVWPYGFTASRDARGSVVVKSGTGRVVARVGSELTAAGGSVSAGHDLACRITPPQRDVASLDGEFSMGSP